jgi:ribose 5-phosphate isomerase B
MTPSSRAIAIGSDHRGLPLKNLLKTTLTELGMMIEDAGTGSAESCDYPLFAKTVASSVSEQRCERGVLICGSGIGMAIVANKFPGVRAALCRSVQDARRSRQHNDANILALSEDIEAATARQILTAWLETPFDGGERHQRRLAQIRQIEAENFKNPR